ncbi:uncharacterized protein [Oryctolagus cuniculus]|uniref:uncharacterized protein n=1 Tax=Oryctolagus cuniculus TaxID=9986 RepID=UPI003877C96F
MEFLLGNPFSTPVGQCLGRGEGQSDEGSVGVAQLRRIKGAWPRARGSAFLRVGRGRVSVRSGPRLGTAETRAGRLDAPSAAALSVQDGVPPGESVQHAGGAVPRHDIIGEFTTSYREHSRGQSQFNVYEVVNPKKKGKKKKYTNSGTVTLRSFLVETEVSFLDYIKGGARTVVTLTNLVVIHLHCCRPRGSCSRLARFFLPVLPVLAGMRIPFLLQVSV